MFIYAKISNVSWLGVVGYNGNTVLSHSLDMRLTKGRMMMLL